MLKMAELKESDFVVDLGCGDGRILVTAAQRYGAKGLGVDFEAQRIVEANENAKKAGVSDKVEFRRENLFDTDISNVSVLTLYLSLAINIKLRPRILETLKPGARVLSHDFNMGDWLPDRTERISDRVVYLWVVPAKVGGNWQLSYDGPHGPMVLELSLGQQFQQLSGNAVMAGKAAPLRDALVTGDGVGFAVDIEGRSMRFDGHVATANFRGTAGRRSGSNPRGGQSYGTRRSPRRFKYRQRRRQRTEALPCASIVCPSSPQLHCCCFPQLARRRSNRRLRQRKR